MVKQFSGIWNDLKERYTSELCVVATTVVVVVHLVVVVVVLFHHPPLQSLLTDLSHNIEIWETR
jgi:hypothetical protein